jgi:hypothetical protein
MRALLTNAVYYDGRKGRKWFYCHVKIYARAVGSGAPISGFSVQGTWSVSPDHDGFTDANSEMNLAVAGDIGATHTRGATDSPWIPVKDALAVLQPTQYPAGSYPGTKCIFTLGSLTHPDYVLDPEVSTITIESALL